jgi:hypothetical protein
MAEFSFVMYTGSFVAEHSFAKKKRSYVLVCLSMASRKFLEGIGATVYAFQSSAPNLR